jgi:hypothetical protein
MKGLIDLKQKNILKYYFYQKPFKKGKKYYFLLDFFKGLKGVFFIKKLKKIKAKKYMRLFKSFNSFSSNLSATSKFDYFIKDFNEGFYNLLKSNKKKNCTRLISYMNEGLFCSSFSKSTWLLQYFLNEKKLFSNKLNLGEFTPFSCLNIYYYFLKQKLIVKVYKNLNKYLKQKQCIDVQILSYKLILFNDLYFFSNYEMALNLFSLDAMRYLHNKYNRFKSLKLLLINRAFKKLNRRFKDMKIYKKAWNSKFKAHVKVAIQLLKEGSTSFFSKLLFFSGSNKLKFSVTYEAFKEEEEEKPCLIKLNFFFNLAYRLYAGQRISRVNSSSILLKYYLYFYNFIIKTFIKLLNNFKFIIFNKHSLLVKHAIWFKIFLIFYYYKKILINKFFGGRYKRSLFRLKKNVNVRLISSRFSKFIGRVSIWRKKIINERLSNFLKEESYRLKLIKKIKRFKKGRYFIYLRVNGLKKIYNKLSYKINKMAGFKKSGILKTHKLKKFIINNKLKQKSVLKFLKLKLKRNA